jgi:uncharacterized cupin superfamily protein
MPLCKLVKPGDRRFRSVVPEQPSILRACRDADSDVSGTIAAGVTVFENCRLPWEMAYDEYLYCLEGVLRVREDDVVHEMRSGDGLWLPKGVKVVYECDGRSTLVFAIYPIDWREQLAKKEASRRKSQATRARSKAKARPSRARAAGKPSRKAASPRRSGKRRK